MVKGAMTKDTIMQYTMVSLFFIAFISYWIFGVESLIVCLISVGVAIGCDLLIYIIMGSKVRSNLNSAMVFGLIVGLSYSLGLTPAMMYNPELLPPTLAGGIETYIYPALISAVGMIVFKKLQGLSGRKYVNPAAAAKLLVLGLLFMPVMATLYNTSALIPEDHELFIDLQNPMVTDENWRAIYSWKYNGESYDSLDTVPFAANLLSCYSNNATLSYYVTTGDVSDPLPAVLDVMLLAKYHGWIGGFSSILVIAVGIALFAVNKKYFKWRITLTFLISTAVFAGIMGVIYGGDIVLRMLFHVFMGSSIFMAFFMATDPATTPITRKGQIIFGIGLALLTILIQTYIKGFLGGSILALVIMNLTCPLLDRVGVPKVRKERRSCGRLPKGRDVTEATTTQCIRCGSCLYVCAGRLPTISIKEAADKGDWARVKKLGVEYCQQCGTCSFVCPARIDLKAAMLAAREKVKNM
jgi:Na+-translocating ferredoxin:NAD+ oxidoreductase RnfD subunit/Pyruvate/2-oxoacid:ferredoxin oxidoreductase delta subunit